MNGMMENRHYIANKKLLTIVVPTYNRGSLLLDTLRAMLPEVEKYQEDVSIMVCDNASSDNTEVIVSGLESKYPFLMYYRHCENIGAHQNFYFGVEKSNSWFVYLLGDDDIPCPHFLDIILPMIKKRRDNLGLLHFNYLYGDAGLKRETLFNSSFNAPQMCVDYNGYAEFIRTYWVGPSFMSSVIFRKECMMKGKEDMYRPDCYGYDWLLCLFKGLTNYTCTYYKMPLLIQRLGGIYRNLALNTILGQYKVFNYLEEDIPGIKDLWIQQMYNKYNMNIFGSICTIPLYRANYIEYYDEMKEVFKDRSFYRCLLFIAVKLPSFLSIMALNYIKFLFLCWHKFCKNR